MFAIPAVVKMNYIIDALNTSGYEVCVISPSFILKNKKYSFDKGGYKKINEFTKLWLPPSFGLKTKLGKYCSAFISLFFWFFKLLKLNNKDTLIVYHTPVLSLPIRLAKKIKNFNLIVEIEEIYTFAFDRSKKTLKKEMKLIKSTKKHIVVNDLISDLIGIDKSKTITCYGPYKINRNIIPKKFTDGKIHIVYAGSFSLSKGGVQNAINAARYLSTNYIMHILGFGTNNEIDEVKNLINEVNELKVCEVHYEGEKHGEEYQSFMKGCSIGLNPQKWGKYMLYAYPSKILVYLSLGLNVVTSPLKSLTLSSLNPYLNYFYEETPQAIAEAIMKAKIFPSDELQAVVSNLNNEFVNKLDKLIQK